MLLPKNKTRRNGALFPCQLIAVGDLRGHLVRPWSAPQHTPFQTTRKGRSAISIQSPSEGAPHEHVGRSSACESSRAPSRVRPSSQVRARSVTRRGNKPTYRPWKAGCRSTDLSKPYSCHRPRSTVRYQASIGVRSDRNRASGGGPQRADRSSITNASETRRPVGTRNRNSDRPHLRKTNESAMGACP